MYYISFLKTFKDWENLTVNQQIIYSYFVNSAIMQQQGVWASDGSGKLVMRAVSELIYYNSFLTCPKVTNDYISEKTGISLRTVAATMRYLRESSLVFINRNQYEEFYVVNIPRGLVESGFLKLPKNTGLKGMQLIFWAFINERLKHYNAKTGRIDNLEIDSWASRIARDMGIKKKDAQNYIHILTKRNYLQRSEDGKYLKINKDLVNLKTTKQLSEEMKK
ncbi:MAG: replication/maintenance protein RepL [Bacteroidales bacterium]|jgi:hypothetical protein|nr:replication/maintenance protein RepL [Bacteroidales bacterium]